MTQTQFLLTVILTATVYIITGAKFVSELAGDQHLSLIKKGVMMIFWPLCLLVIGCRRLRIIKRQKLWQRRN